MQPAPGADDERSEAAEANRDDSKTCSECGATLEWTLDVDGVQHLECPNCE
ncbi:hypothetical protein ACFQAS_05745 [Halopenitus salinus]|jgi:transposase|uniref:Small CPxCG-related zinc finger protein n=1 Tax=Halopenitus salinus TaxID=1198295 RepID=A0ABD5V2Z0_9EURY